MNKIGVMIIEDSGVVRLLLEEIINGDSRLRVAASVSSAEEGLRLLSQVRPDVISMDIRLPGMNGLEVLRQMKSEPALKNVPVVMLTSSGEEPDLTTSYALGANAYVTKPVDFTGFVDAVKQVGLFWAVLNEPPPDRLESPHAA